MASGKTILAIGRDQGLLLSRTLLLEHEGYSVVALHDFSVQDFLQQSKGTPVDVVLVCYTVPPSSRDMLARLMHLYFPNSPVLMMHSRYESAPTQADATLEGLTGPRELLNSVKALLPLASPGEPGT